jgi:transketolase
MAIMAASTEHAITLHRPSWIGYVGPQIAVIAVDTFGASSPVPVVMEHYGFTVDNICSRTRHLLLETRRQS